MRSDLKINKPQFNWLERTLSGMTGAIEQAFFSQYHARLDGWLQRLDPRMKWLLFLCLALTAGLSRSLWVLLALHILLFIVAIGSALEWKSFLQRVWLGVPVFAGIVILPSIFFTTGERLFSISLGGLVLGVSWQSLLTATIFLVRVGVSISLAALLVLTTPWADLLKSLQVMRVPQVFILLLSMTYRYIFLVLHTANGMFEARRSRTVGRTSSQEKRRWIGGSISALMHRSFRLSQDVYMAMLARGFQGSLRNLTTYRFQRRDWLALALTLLIVALCLTGEYGGFWR